MLYQTVDRDEWADGVVVGVECCAVCGVDVGEVVCRSAATGRLVVPIETLQPGARLERIEHGDSTQHQWRCAQHTLSASAENHRKARQ